MGVPGPWCALLILVSVPPAGSPAVTAGGQYASQYSTPRFSATHFDDASLPSLLLSRMGAGSGMILSLLGCDDGRGVRKMAETTLTTPTNTSPSEGSNETSWGGGGQEERQRKR